jgi:hypothetical protein
MVMTSSAAERYPGRPARPFLMMFLVAVLLALLIPASSLATITTIGSPLTVPATLNTSENLTYEGTNTAVPPSPEAPNGVFHTNHDGADTALWNGGEPVPVTGQALKVSLEGCAQPAANGPAPLTQIHFQDLSPLPGGGAKVNLTSQSFEIPVCGGGAGGSTVSTYEPVNLCVSQGDYVSFNDEGGYVENVYRSGVPYQVIGSVGGSMMDSFIRGNGTGNGAIFSPSDTTPGDGFAANPNEELMMQVTLATGADESHVCAGGTAGLAPLPPPLRVAPQTDGVNHERIVSVAIVCRVAPECKGTAKLTLGGNPTSYGHTAFSLPPDKTMHVPIRVSRKLFALIRKHHGVATAFTAVVDGTTITQTISIKIL